MPREPIYRLPPYRTEMVLKALAETIDWGLALYGVPDLWKQSRGSGIRVAVLDTGIDDVHPDLRDVVVEARDFSSSPVGWQDHVGHGTHVAGVVAARQNDVGVVGICPGLTENGGGLLVGKVLADNGAGLESWVAAGIAWAIEAKADIISMSLGSRSPGLEMHAAIGRAVREGIFVICAAGNNGMDNSVDYPGRYSETIAVAAVDRHGRVAPFSSRGEQVDIAAPGQDVLSTYPGSRYAKLSGTSMATPFVTAVVALMLSKHRQQGGKTPINTVEQLREHLARTADDAGSPGKDPAYGYGLINPGRMLAGLSPPEPPVWAGLRWDVDIGGEPAAFVLVPRDANLSINF
ncbi:MAG: S8 family peptidase [Pirellulales bacterium]